jgi:AraC-like DNA-binding protein
MLTKPSTEGDLLSATLATMKLAALNITTIEAGGRWAMELPAAPVLRLQVVLRGECWLAVEGEKRKHHFRAGDCFLLPHAKGLVMASDLSVKKRQPLHRLIRHPQDGVVSLVCNEGRDFFAAGSAFQLEGHFQDLVFSRLPSVIHVPADADHAAVLRWAIERFAVEVRNARPGRALMLSHLAPIMLLQVLRGYLATADGDRNWLVALSEPRLSRALAAMQSDPARGWSLDGLARTAGLSRAGFALNFKKWIGVTPMEYLTQWRVQLACELHEEEVDPASNAADTIAEAAVEHVTIRETRLDSVAGRGHQSNSSH